MSVSSAFVLPRWIVIWFLVTIPIMLWDSLFILFRPASLPGGSLDWVWWGYRYYIAVDTRYGNINDTLVIAFTWGNLIEMALSLLVCFYHKQRRPESVLWAFAVAWITLTKTFLYLGCEWASGRASTGQASLLQFLGLYLLLNGLWLLVPGLIAWKTGQQLLQNATHRD